MDNRKNNLKEQQAPIKNNDDAFVRVGQDGAPVIPDTADDEETNATENDRSTRLDEE